MVANAAASSILESFRSVWICGHLDYQRAAEGLEEAIRAADDSLGTEGGLPAQQSVEDARRRLAEVEEALGAQFDRFCGLAP